MPKSPPTARPPTRCSDSERATDGHERHGPPSRIRSAATHIVPARIRFPARLIAVFRKYSPRGSYPQPNGPVDMPSFAQSLEKTLHGALQNATDRSHEYATLE